MERGDDPSDVPAQAVDHDDDFIRMFGKAQSSLHSYLLGVTLNPSDADDLLQEVNLALWRKRSSYDPSQEFLRWAIGFAKTQVLSHRARSAKSKLVFSDEAVQALAADWQEDHSYHQTRLEALANCVGKLGDLENQILYDLYGRNRSVRDLAEARRMPQSTVYKLLDRIRKALVRCVEVTVASANHPV
ncbi:MAG: sigma-70 family RNA polymerase sigma factor [Lacipirellulaceae bacterium]